MCTINALCLDSLPGLLDQVLALRKIYGRSRVSFSLNILRFPSFQSPLVLPDHLRQQYKESLEAWLSNKDIPLLHEYEMNHVQRLIDYLDVVKTPHKDAAEVTVLQQDFKQFFTQYDQRRNKNFVNAFPNLAEWYNSL